MQQAPAAVVRRFARLDLTIAASAAVATLAITLYCAPRGFNSGFVDMGHDGYQLRQVLDLSRGGVIFKDTFDQYGPLNGYINLVGFLALGHRLLAIKYFICIWYAVTAVVLYILSREWLTPPLAGFTAIVWLGLAPFFNHGIMISPHAYVLLLQAVATLIALRSPDLAPRRFAAIGLLAGLSWALKQSMGVLFVLAIVSYLLFQLVIGRAGTRRVVLAVAATSLAFAAVVGIALALMWRYGALGDWYLQTFVFPREFYLVSSVPAGMAGPGRVMARILEPLNAFARLQWTQPVYWILIRAVVVLTALVQVIRRRPDDKLLLMASLTMWLWLAAYPSGNFMHQWWTTSLTFAPFVVCIERLSARWTSGVRTSWATVVVVSIIVGSGFLDRWDAAVFNANALTETIVEPPLFRGVRTSPPIKRAFETLYEVMARYRVAHPGTRVVTIESADGWGGGIVETLTFLSFFEDNTHPQPVYWSLPVLSTTLYPRYGETLWRQVREERPLVVEHYSGRFKPIRISGYQLLAAAQSEYGHWYVFAPVEEKNEPATYLAWDGAMERGFPVDGRTPSLAARLSSGIEGGWRGRVEPSYRRDDTIHVPGDNPFDLVDPAFDNSKPVNIYTWPSDLPKTTIRGPVEPVPTDVIWRGGKGDIVRELRPGAWTVDGNATQPLGYLLQWGDQPVARGRSFIVRGEIVEGGLQVGFLEANQWKSYVTVTRRGPFEAVIEIQKSGRYALVLANCITSSWQERALRHPIGAPLGLIRGAFLPNHFRITQAGWVDTRPSNLAYPD
jgi:hypothetical protein